MQCDKNVREVIQLHQTTRSHISKDTVSKNCFCCSTTYALTWIWEGRVNSSSSSCKSSLYQRLPVTAGHINNCAIVEFFSSFNQCPFFNPVVFNLLPNHKAPKQSINENPRIDPSPRDNYCLNMPKGKAVPAGAMKSNRSRGKRLIILNAATRWRQVASLTLRPVYLGK